MDPNDQLVTMRCPHCNHREVCDRLELEQRLREIGMLRRDSSVDWQYLLALLETAAQSLDCGECARHGLICMPLETEDDDEAWGQTRKCAGCRQPIPAERLELFPNAELCPACQSREERGESVGAEVEYCSHCGDILTVQRAAGSGIARYIVRCPSCGRK